MKNSLVIKCPCCGGQIVADRNNGDVLSHEKLGKKEEKRSMSELLDEVKSHKQKVMDRFEVEKEAQKNRNKVLDEMFSEGLKRVEKRTDKLKDLFKDDS